MFVRASCSISPLLFVNRTFSSKAAAAVSTQVNSKKKIRHTKREAEKIAPMNVNNAVGHLKKQCWAKFDETIEIAVVMGVDPRKPNQSIKGISTLPHGTGKKIRIGVFAQGADADAAIREGADEVGGADLIAKVQGGEINFDRVIATPEMMPALSKIGRVSPFVVMLYCVVLLFLCPVANLNQLSF
jgi:ribosomal protein L1